MKTVMEQAIRSFLRMKVYMSAESMEASSHCLTSEQKKVMP
jgi:hypothetical protein